jgi:anti-sigma regulatory factor (Ser/Thr protein kinase)
MAVHYFDPNGVESLRDNGYRDTAMALSELIDNSIQAHATKIEIVLVERLSSIGRKEWLVNEIFVLDNGEGMDKQTLETSLRFGGGTRHGASKGLGKFGMGLPNSSASQCTRFEVYTWKKNGNILFNYFDFKEIKNNKSEYLPDVIESNFPNHINIIAQTISKSGTLVRWVNCDRLILRRANKLVPHIAWPLGRIFRYFIDDKKVEIKVRVFQDNGSSYSENFSLGKTIKAVDPLFLMTDTQLPIPFSSHSTNQLWQDGEYLFPDPNGDKENKELFNVIGDSVKIKLSLAKPETKRLGGDSELGRIYRQFIGISVLRAGREIKLDDFGFIGELGDPLNRWWKVEIAFEPNFDVYFGLDNTKQNVHAFRKIIDKDELERTDDDTQLEFICKFSEFLENQIRLMKKDIDLIDAGSRGGAKGGTGNKGPNDPNSEDVDNGPFPPDAFPVPIPTEEEPKSTELETDEEKEELKRWLLNRYPEYDEDEVKLNLAIEWFFKTEYNQVIVFSQLGAASFYEFKPIGHKVIIEINTEHEFYLEFIRPIFDENDLYKIDQLLILFGSMVEAEKELISYSQYISKFRSLFAVKLSQFIFDWKEKK